MLRWSNLVLLVVQAVVYATAGEDFKRSRNMRNDAAMAGSVWVAVRIWESRKGELQ